MHDSVILSNFPEKSNIPELKTNVWLLLDVSKKRNWAEKKLPGKSFERLTADNMD